MKNLNKSSYKYYSFLLIIIISLTINYNCDLEFYLSKRTLNSVTINVDTVTKNSLPSDYFVIYSSNINYNGLPNIKNTLDVIIKIPKNSNSPLSSLLPTPTKSCFTFTGWFSDPSFTIKADLTNPSSLSNLYAGWSRNQTPITNPLTFKINYYADGSTFETQTVDSCSSISPPASSPHKAGYAFTTWYLDPEKTIPYDFSYPIATDVKLYAGFKKTFNVTFISNSKNYSQITVDSGNVVNRPSINPNEAGYTFVDWYTSSAYIVLFDFTTKIISNTEIYAKNTPNSYEVTFDNNGGNGVDPIKVVSDQNLHILPPTTKPTKLGFNLGGWNEYPISVSFNFDFINDKVVNNMTLYAQWYNANTVFNVKVADENGVFQTLPTNYNGKLSPPQTPTKIGYDFVEWNSLPNGNGKKFDFNTDSVQSNLSLYPIFKPRTYTIIYENNNGSVIVASAFEFGSVITPPSTPITRTGYTIASWNTAPDGTGNPVVFGISTVSTNIFHIDATTTTLSIFPIWSPIQYTITYDNNGGNGVAPSSVKVDYNAVIPAPTTLPTNAGFTISSWNTSSLGTGTNIDFGSTLATQSLTIYPIWISSVDYVVLTFNKGTGDTDASPLTRTVPSGSTVTCPTILPTKTGHVFTSWNTGPGGNGFQFICGTTPLYANTYVYAQYTPVFTLTYDNNGGTGVNPTSLVLKQNSVIIAPTTLPTLAGKAISKWNTAPDGSGADITFGTITINSDLRIYPIWVNVYTVTYDNNGGSGVNPTSLVLKQNSVIIAPTTLPTLAKKAISKWNTAADGTGTDIIFGSTTINSDLRIFPIWVDTYILKYDNNGGSGVSPTSVTLVKGSIINAPTILPTLAGKFISGWITSLVGFATEIFFGTSTISSDLTIYPIWSPSVVKYTITYDNNQGSGIAPSSTQVNVGSTLPAPTTYPTRTGYSIASWNTMPDGSGTNLTFGTTIVSSNLTVYPIWSQITNVTVTFNDNGANLSASPNKRTIPYNTTCPAPTSLPTKLSSIISSWNTKPDGLGDTFYFDKTLVTADLIIYPIWVTAYTITYSNNGGSGVSPKNETVIAGKTAKGPTTLPTYPGKTLTSWNVDNLGTGNEVIFGVTPITTSVFNQGTFVLFAIWTPNFTVFFNKNGGDTDAVPISKVASASNMPITAPTTLPTKAGFTIKEWNTKADGSGSKFIFGTTGVTTVITIYAIWQ